MNADKNLMVENLIQNKGLKDFTCTRSLLYDLIVTWNDIIETPETASINSDESKTNY